MKEGPSSKNSAALKQTSSSAPKLLKTETRLDPAANSESYERSDKVFVVEQDLKIDEKSGEQQRPREIEQQVIEQRVIEQPEVEQPRTWATAKLSNRNLSNREFEILGTWPTRELQQQELEQPELEQPELQQLGTWDFGNLTN